MKLRYYEDISYRTRGGRFVRVTPGDHDRAHNPAGGHEQLRDPADGKARSAAGGSKGAKVVK
jgi:hypothetical protein